MILKIKFIASFMLIFFMRTTLYGQQNTHYYYYKGAKKYLKLHTGALFVSGTNLQSVQRATVNGQQKASEIRQDRLPVTIRQIGGGKKTMTYYYWKALRLKTTSERNYYKTIHTLKNTYPELIVAPYFISDKGNEIGLSSYFYVRLKHKEDLTVLKKLADKYSITIEGYNQFMPLWFTLRVGADTFNALEMSKIFYETGFFKAVEPDLMTKTTLQLSDEPKRNSLLRSPNDTDPFYIKQWGLNNTGAFPNGATQGIDIKAENAWEITTGSSDIKVAVLDHGFERNHPDLQANVFEQGYDTETGTSPSNIYGNHGTACAGIIAAKANNSIGLRGVAPDVRLVSISNFMDLNPDSRQRRANGINWAMQNGIDIISNSWSFDGGSELIDEAIKQALTEGRNGLGCVLVFSTGDPGHEEVSYPANSHPDILAVGAIQEKGKRYTVSNYGIALDVVAPGRKIVTTDREGDEGATPSDYRFFSGTSAAAPFVAGVAALVLSINPNLSVQEVNSIIEQSAQKVRLDLYDYTATENRLNGLWNVEMGYGLVDAYEALLLAQRITCYNELIVTQDVFANSTDTQSARFRLNAKNTIHTNGLASYDAGTRIRLQPGFRAMEGAFFRAYIEGCHTNLDNSRAIHTIADENSSITQSIPIKEVENKESKADITLYPNPTTDWVEIYSNVPIIKYILSNYWGKPLKLGAMNGNTLRINLSHFSTGLYIIQLETTTGVLIKKKIIKH